jgi:hypothetical protein
MRPDNSVLFALRDLRALETERVAEEQRAEQQRRVEEERRRRAEEQLRRAEEERQSEAAVQRRREQQEREALALALREKSGHSEQLEADVRHLRELLSAAQPSARPRRLWPIGLLAGVVATLGLVLALQRPTVRERIVYVPSPPPPIAPLPAAPALTRRPEAALPVTHPERPRVVPHFKPKRTKAVTRSAGRPPTLHECGGKDPLCGTPL